MGTPLSARSRLLLWFLVRRPTERWAGAELLEAAGVAAEVGWAALDQLLEHGLVVRHPCDDALVRFTASSAGRLRCKLGT